jgi:ribonuclease BN (tRNA processing enzyme)
LTREASLGPEACDFTVIGCGTVVPEPDRACSAYWLETGPLRLLLDCGPGSLRALARTGRAWHAVTDLAISHFHADHTGEIPGLLFALTYGLLPERRCEPLDVWGPPGTAEFFARLSAAYGEFVLDPGFEVRVHETMAGGFDELRAEVVLRTHSTPHTDESRALRIELPETTIVYTGDTGPSDSLSDFCSGAELLVCECSLPDSHAIDTHLSPTSVARLAATADPDLLLLTHVYPQFRQAVDVPRLVGEAGWAGKVELAREGWTRRLST